MIGWIKIAVAVTSTGIFLLLLFFIVRRFFRHRKPPPIAQVSSLQTGIAKLNHQDTLFNTKRRSNYHVFRRGFSSKPLFNWSDNPSLTTDAVENGWSRFAFTNFTSSPALRSTRSLLTCATADSGDGEADTVAISWEVCQGSADFLQKIRFKSAASVIKSALPLPGPALGNSSPFPQEAYFEISILSDFEEEIESDVKGMVGANKGEGEKIKLIQESPAGEKANSESLVHVTSERGVYVKPEELRGRSDNKDKVEGKNDVSIMLSIGLTGGGAPPVKLPGSFPGSVGFNSDGSVFLEGSKLAFESEAKQWDKPEKVIGCGYNPSEKKVFFTVDSRLIHEIHCKTEEFGTPLYPTLAANSEVTVLVNFGQCVFKYAPMNLQRTPNPCFIGPLANSLGYEDSKELFSMGRIDSHWLDRSATRSTQYNGSVNRGNYDYDESSEGDLFEIVLDSNSRGRSPSTPF